MSRFEECLAFVLKCEGGFTDDPLDRGGATNCGITQREYSSFLTSCGLAHQSVKNIKAHEVEAIYKVGYWNKARCAEVHPPLDLVLFDSAVNHGVHKAVKMLQEVVGADVDGHFGPDTMAMVGAATMSEYGAKMVASLVVDERRLFYGQIVDRDPSQNRFIRGWLNRLDKLKTAAGLQM
jgi:lysozyme family protein